MRKQFIQRKGILFSFSLSVILAMAACGTTSKIKPTSSSAPPSTKKSSKGDTAIAFDITPYNRVVVLDFADQATEVVKEKKKGEKKLELEKAVVDFADKLAFQIKARGGFSRVEQNGRIDAKTLVVGGNITKYEKGSSTARLLIGFGAGSAHFEADVEFRDGSSQKLLGIVEVDKNSWALGGAIAASQEPENLMDMAAKKIAEQLAQMR